MRTPIVEVAIIGAGPVGLELAAYLKQLNVPYLHFEAEQIGYTLTNYSVSSSLDAEPERLSLAGVPLKTRHHQPPTRDEYLNYLRTVADQFALEVRTYEKVTHIARRGDIFQLRTRQYDEQINHYRARRVVLATGNMHAPQRPAFPGCNSPRVHCDFADPHRYFRRSVLVVGDNDLALETALRCKGVGARVTFSYRNIDWMDSDRYAALESEARQGRLWILPYTEVRSLDQRTVLLRGEDGEEVRLETDFLLFRLGFVPDHSLLHQLDIALKGPKMAPVYDPHTMETNVMGVYVAGSLAAGLALQTGAAAIEEGHLQVSRIIGHLLGPEAQQQLFWLKAMAAGPHTERRRNVSRPGISGALPAVP